MSATFTFEQGKKKYTIPAFNDMPAGAIRKARKASDDMDKAFTIIEAALGEDSAELAALDRMSIKEFGEFVTDWTGQTGSDAVSLGESSDS